MSNRRFVVFEPGLPMCGYDGCPEYDGSKCKETGQRPGFLPHCEPELKDKLEALQAELEETRAQAQLLFEVLRDVLDAISEKMQCAP